MTIPAPSWTERDLREALDVYEDELRAAGKTRNTIATYVQHPERFINWLVKRAGRMPRAGAPADPPRSVPSSPRSSKYDPLREHLADTAEPVITMTFADVERVLGVELPPSAFRHAAWWANEASGSHINARAWLEAGRRTANVDLNTQRVDFVKARGDLRS